MEILNKLIPPDNVFFRILNDIPWNGLYLTAKYFFIGVDIFLVIAIALIEKEAKLNQKKNNLQTKIDRVSDKLGKISKIKSEMADI